MKKPYGSALPDLDSDYADAYGQIDLIVYSAAVSIWPHALSFASRVTCDEVLARDLMLRTVVRVSRRCRAARDIEHLERYLLLVFKRLVCQETKLLRRRSIPPIRSDAIRYQEAVQDLERTILLREVMRRMDAETSRVFEKRVLGFSFNEIAVEESCNAHVLRTRFSRRMSQLAKQINAEAKKVGPEVEEEDAFNEDARVR